MLNSLCLIGRLTADLKLEGKDNNYARFSLAFENVRKEANGDRGTSFINCVAFSKVAEALVNHTAKGSKVGLTGSIQQQTWTTKEGKKASDIVFYVDTITFLDAKTKEEQAVEDAIEPTTPAFDPYTGKPLKK